MEGLTRLRVVHDPPAAGDWNMAADEMMLESVASSGEPILRFYQWQEPTLSLGYFQALEERQAHSASLSCPVVRRSTGGGAILHDRELTYSFALPIKDRWSRAAGELYDVMHDALLAVLAGLGLTAQRCPATNAALQQHFLCFQRRAAGDVLVGEQKVCGSAQRRRQGALLQHGSAILAKSRSAPEIVGLQELGASLTSDELSTRWLVALQNNWPDLIVTESTWTHDQRGRAAAIQKGRFASPAWLTRRRSP